MKVSMTEKKSSYLLGSLQLLFSSCCCIAFVGFILYFRLWGNALWSGPGVVGTAAGWMQVLLSWWDQQNLRWSLKQTLPLTTKEEKTPPSLWPLGNSSLARALMQSFALRSPELCFYSQWWAHRPESTMENRSRNSSARMTLLGVGKPSSPPMYGC